VPYWPMAESPPVARTTSVSRIAFGLLEMMCRLEGHGTAIQKTWDELPSAEKALWREQALIAMDLWRQSIAMPVQTTGPP
jgi:hypothetical protein